MRIRDLEDALREIEPFQNPKAKLEQYPTSAHLAAQVVHTIDSSFDDITDKYILDLGCGTGMLSIACSIMGAASVVGMDIDEDALAAAKKNADNMEVSDNVEFCQLDVTKIADVISSNKRFMFDTVIMNPPFGTKRKGVDIAFLQAAVQMSNTSVYSMHKSSTRDYILKKATTWNAKAEPIAMLHFDIPRMYQFHSSDTKDVQVDLWRLDVTCIDPEIIFEPINVSPANFERPYKMTDRSKGKQASSARRGRNNVYRGRGKRR